MNFFNHILQNYGKESVKLVRSAENVCKKLARFRNHLRYTLRCLDEHITPPSLRLRRPGVSKNCDNIVKKAERALLNDRVREINRKIVYLKDKSDTLDNRLHAKFQGHDLETALEIVQTSYEREFSVVKERQLKKLDSLKSMVESASHDKERIPEHLVKNGS